MIDIKKTWCLGFVFSNALRHVVLVKKSRMHAGLWNGVGGKVDEGEDYLESMVRECQEEAGMITDRDDWITVGDLRGVDWNVRVFGLRDQAGFNIRPDMLPGPGFLVGSWSLLEGVRPDIPMFLPVASVSLNIPMAPHTGALVHASLAALRDLETVSPITITVS